WETRRCRRRSGGKEARRDAPPPRPWAQPRRSRGPRRPAPPAGRVATTPASRVVSVPQLALDRIAPVDRDRGAGHEIGGGASEKYRHAGEVVGHAPAVRRRAGEHAVVQAVDLAARVLGE